MGKRKPEDQPAGDQMYLFGFQVPSAPKLVTDSSQVKVKPNSQAERRRVEEVLFDRRCAHRDGWGVQLININGGVSQIQVGRDGTYVSQIGGEGEVYQVNRFPGPSGLTFRQEALIGLTPRRSPKAGSPPPAPSLHSDPNLVGHYQPEELTDDVRARLEKMADLARSALR